MSTERDETTPIPAQPGDQPTTPIPRPGTGRTEEPTLVFDTFPPEPTQPTQPIGPTAAAPGPGPDATRPLPAPEHVTPRTSAFAAAGAGAGGGAGAAGAGAAPTVGGVPAPDPASDPVRTPDDRPVPGDPGISTSLRVGTVVWGLVLAIIGAGVVAIAAGATFDLELALIGLLALAGIALVVGSVVSASRHRR